MLCERLWHKFNSTNKENKTSNECLCTIYSVTLSPCKKQMVTCENEWFFIFIAVIAILIAMLFITCIIYNILKKMDQSRRSDSIPGVRTLFG